MFGQRMRSRKISLEVHSLPFGPSRAKPGAGQALAYKLEWLQAFPYKNVLDPRPSEFHILNPTCFLPAS